MRDYLDRSPIKADDSGRTFLRRCCVVIPTYNAGPFWPALHAALEQQGLARDQVLVIDSSSTDRTRQLVQEAGYQLHVIPKKLFRHGATRQLAADLVQHDFLIYLTQDAVPQGPECLRTLLSAFRDADVGAAYGRQVANVDANPLDRHARLFNYREDSETRDFASSKTLGFRAAFFSNSFAAYRRTAFEQVGGFPPDTIVSEDVSVAARMLLANWKIAYQAEAAVMHSHRQTLFQEFSRYFDIGVHHGREQWIIDAFGGPGGEGRAFVQSQMSYLWTVQPGRIPGAMVRNASKWLAYRLGTQEQHLPLVLRRKLSAQKPFWDDADRFIRRSELTRATGANAGQCDEAKIGR